MNYDTMTVHELVNLLVDIDSPAMRRVGIEETGAIESALRKTVIKEASVGTMKCLRRPIMGCNQYGDEFQTGHIDERATEPPCLPDGTYDLIPKETP